MTRVVGIIASLAFVCSCMQLRDSVSVPDSLELRTAKPSSDAAGASKEEAFGSEGNLVFHAECKKVDGQFVCDENIESIEVSALISMVKNEINHRVKSLKWLQSQFQDLQRRYASSGLPKQAKLDSKTLQVAIEVLRRIRDDLISAAEEAASEPTNEARILYRYNGLRSAPDEGQIMAELFTRLRLKVQDELGKTWRFAGNDQLFFAADQRCQDLFPGSRLPTSLDVKELFSFEQIKGHLKPHHRASEEDPSLVGFWTSDLPTDPAYVEYFQSIEDLENRAWATVVDNEKIAGQLVLMTSRSSLLCVVP